MRSFDLRGTKWTNVSIAQIVKKISTMFGVAAGCPARQLLEYGIRLSPTMNRKAKRMRESLVAVMVGWRDRMMASL